MVLITYSHISRLIVCMTFYLILEVVLWLYTAISLVLIMVDFLMIDCRKKLLLLCWCRYWVFPILANYHFFIITFVGFFSHFSVRETSIVLFLMSNWSFCVCSVIDIFWNFENSVALGSTHFVTTSRSKLRKSCIIFTRLDHWIPFKKHFLTSSRFLVEFLNLKFQSLWEVVLLFILSKLELLYPLFIRKFICWCFLNHFLIYLV